MFDRPRLASIVMVITVQVLTILVLAVLELAAASSAVPSLGIAAASFVVLALASPSLAVLDTWPDSGKLRSGQPYWPSSASRLLIAKLATSASWLSSFHSPLPHLTLSSTAT